MKAIINIQNKNNQYSKYNNLTFEVKDLMNGKVGLVGVNPEFPNNQVDFSFEEIIIVDIEKEMQAARENADWVSSYEYASKYQCLINYCQLKGLKNNTKWVPAQ